MFSNLELYKSFFSNNLLWIFLGHCIYYSLAVFDSFDFSLVMCSCSSFKDSYIISFSGTISKRFSMFCHLSYSLVDFYSLIILGKSFNLTDGSLECFLPDAIRILLTSP